MKSFLISIHPGWIIKIFNGDKTAEIRKNAPKDWKDYLSGKTKKKPEPMTGYIYCTKGDYLHHNKNGWFVFDMPTTFIAQEDFVTVKEQKPFNGKVCAKFMLKEVEELYSVGNKNNGHLVFETKSDGIVQLYKRSCLDFATLSDYLKPGKRAAWGYAWHISDLQIFDEPKELSDFEYLNPSGIVTISQRSLRGLPKHPPQSFCYVEEKK